MSLYKLDRLVKVAALLGVTCTAFFWVSVFPGIPMQRSGTTATVAQQPMTADVDGDGKPETFHLHVYPGEASGRLIVRKGGVQYATAELIQLSSDDAFQLELWDLDPGRKMMAVRCPCEPCGEQLALFQFCSGTIRPLGSFFGEGGLQIADINGDGFTDIVAMIAVVGRDGRERFIPEVYIWSGRDFRFDPRFSNRDQLERPVRP